MEIGGGGQVRCTEAQLIISVGFRPQETGRPDWAEKERKKKIKATSII